MTMATKQDDTVQDWRVRGPNAKRLPLPKACWQDPNKDAFSGDGLPYDSRNGLAVLHDAKNNSD